MLLFVLFIAITGYSIFNGISISLIKPLIDDVFFRSQTEETIIKISETPIKITDEKLTYFPEKAQNFILNLTAFLNKTIYNNLNGISIQKLIFYISIAIFTSIFLKIICLYFKKYLSQYLANKAIINIREDTYNNVLNQPLSFFDSSRTGNILSIIVNDSQELLKSIISGFSDALFYFFEILVLLTIILYIDIELSIISIVIVFILLLPIINISKKLKKRSFNLQEKWGDIISIISETLSGIRVVKAFGKESLELDKTKNENKNLLFQTMKTVKYMVMASPITELAGTVAAIIILFLGSNKILNQEISPGDFILFLTAILSILSPLKRLANAFSQIIKSLGPAQRINFLMNLKSSITEKDNSVELNYIKEKIEFKNVYFAYKKEKFVLKNFNLTIKKGEIVALVGRSGSGKSTVLNLIPRYYDVNKGDILFDNVSIKDIKLTSFVNMIATVSQDTFLFNNSIKYNISYGMQNISMDNIIKAAKNANAHNFIKEMPNQYDTLVGEKGVLLSGGQKQRLSIARAILKNPVILLLDEATSALDTESETLVQEALQNLMHNRTTIVVAHRLSTIVNADKIAVLEDGIIKEIGKHSDLLQNNSIYRKLNDMQLTK